METILTYNGNDSDKDLYQDQSNCFLRSPVNSDRRGVENKKPVHKDVWPDTILSLLSTQDMHPFIRVILLEISLSLSTTHPMSHAPAPQQIYFIYPHWKLCRRFNIFSILCRQRLITIYFSVQKFPNLINHENMEVSNFYFISAKSFPHQSFLWEIVQ